MPHALRNSPLVLASAGLEIAFDRAGDRYRHQISLRDGDETIVLLDSVEGTAAEAWPSSPPFQEIEISRTKGKTQTALLVGMAGRSHWSASVELEPVHGEAVFDMACRADRRAAFLGTAYRVHGDIEVRVSERSVEFRHSRGACRLELNIGDKMARSRLHHHGDEVTIEVALPDGPFPATARWRYRIERS